MDAHNEPPGRQPLLTREILTLAAVVVLGAIMTILDRTNTAVTCNDAR